MAIIKHWNKKINISMESKEDVLLLLLNIVIVPPYQ